MPQCTDTEGADAATSKSFEVEVTVVGSAAAAGRPGDAGGALLLPPGAPSAAAAVRSLARGRRVRLVPMLLLLVVMTAATVAGVVVASRRGRGRAQRAPVVALVPAPGREGDFVRLLGGADRGARVVAEREWAFAHEGPVYLPGTGEVFVTSNRCAAGLK